MLCCDFALYEICLQKISPEYTLVVSHTRSHRQGNGLCSFLKLGYQNYRTQTQSYCKSFTMTELMKFERKNVQLFIGIIVQCKLYMNVESNITENENTRKRNRNENSLKIKIHLQLRFSFI